VVRYSDISHELRQRTVSVELSYEGFVRFSVGLAKKVLLANPLGQVADTVFSLDAGGLTTPVAWLGIIAYTFQIYFDFSGYSDMAIGLARFFGFHFPENFNQPYRARSVTEFWRRWHMTLSRWFRDFLYVPLGGNRKGTARTYANLFLVFLLCGLWHGAAYTFALWGLYHGALLVIERLVKNRTGFEPSGVTGTVYAFLMVTIGWVFFRSDHLGSAFRYLGTLFGRAGHSAPSLYPFRFYLQNDTLAYLLIAGFVAFVPYQRLVSRMNLASPRVRIAQGTAAMLLLLMATLGLSTSGFRAFIYYRF
jgi:alginate O-acetyltransferase complex protein AlgI